MQIGLCAAGPGDDWIVAQGRGRASKGEGLAAGPPQRPALGSWRHLSRPPLAGWGAHSELCFASRGETCRGQDEGPLPPTFFKRWDSFGVPEGLPREAGSGSGSLQSRWNPLAHMNPSTLRHSHQMCCPCPKPFHGSLTCSTSPSP